MPRGTLEVLLVSAKDLEDDNLFAKMDPYVILSVRSQEEKSTVAEGQGSEPEWNETFSFTISGEVDELRLKIMDKDTFSSDDFVGEAVVPLDQLFSEGSLPPTSYKVVNKDNEYHGDIKVGLTFNSEGGNRSGDSDDERRGRRRDTDEGSYRGGRGDSYGSRDYDEDSHGGRRGRKSYGDYDEDSHGGREESYGGY